MHLNRLVTACKHERRLRSTITVLSVARNCIKQINRYEVRAPDDALSYSVALMTEIDHEEEQKAANKAIYLDRVIKICVGRAVSARMTTLSSSACITHAQPRVCHFNPRSRIVKRRENFTIAVRGSFAKPGGFDSSNSYQVILSAMLEFQIIFLSLRAYREGPTCRLSLHAYHTGVLAITTLRGDARCKQHLAAGASKQ